MFIVRKAERKDIREICNFQQLMAVETENKSLNADIILNGVSALVKNPNLGQYYVSSTKIDGKEVLVGCLMITFEWSDWRNGFFIWIQSVFVKKQWREKNVFSLMYNKIENIVKSDTKYLGLRLYVEYDNDIAQKAYTSKGMEKQHYHLYEKLINK